MKPSRRLVSTMSCTRIAIQLWRLLGDRRSSVDASPARRYVGKRGDPLKSSSTHSVSDRGRAGGVRNARAKRPKRQKRDCFPENPFASVEVEVEARPTRSSRSACRITAYITLVSRRSSARSRRTRRAVSTRSAGVRSASRSSYVPAAEPSLVRAVTLPRLAPRSAAPGSSRPSTLEARAAPAKAAHSPGLFSRRKLTKSTFRLRMPP